MSNMGREDLGAGLVPAAAEGARLLVVVDPDRSSLTRTIRALEGRGYRVNGASDLQEAREAIGRLRPFGLVTDLKLADGTGFDLLTEAKRLDPHAPVVFLTGYGSIASAVAAIKLGAADFLVKPAEAEDIDAALQGTRAHRSEAPVALMSADRVRWEHIQRVFEQCERNVSETARQLGMHRRTLQRILAKRPPR